MDRAPDVQRQVGILAYSWRFLFKDFPVRAAEAVRLGEAFFVFMAATVYAAALFEVDPFGQPGVEAGKRLTRRILEGA